MKRLFLIPLMIVLMVLPLLAACEAEEGPEIPAEILIGDTVSYTGPYAVFGGVASFGTEAAIEDINAQGGIYVEEYGTRIPVRWITRDCESDPLKVAPLTEDLILNEHVHFIGGHFEVPTMRQGTAMMAEKYEIPAVFGVGTYEAWIGMREAAAEPWTYSWAFGFSIGTPAQPGDFRADDPGYLMVPTWFGALDAFAAETNKKVAVFAFDDPDGRGWYLEFIAAVAGQGYDCYRAEDQFGIYPPGTTDFTSLIQEWKSYGCEILWGNSIAPDIGTVLKQCTVQGFEPKVVFATRGAMFYQEIVAWGGDLPNGVGMEVYWTPAIQNAEGIGGETPQSLADRWYAATGEPLAQGIGWNYAVAQTLFDAIERAGTLDADAVCQALAETDLITMWGRVVFEQDTQFQRVPCQFGQWQKTDNPWVWESPTVFSYNDFLPATADLIFPKPWD
ncbi:MAG: ABC transporter substrate-binding protein [Dehalococcoidales bacterium]|nr:ABC transporter substrate-binding protein [Dehalococcoidales bacterium]